MFQVIFLPGVEFGARMINIDGKQIKLQIWDTVSCVDLSHLAIHTVCTSSIKLTISLGVS